MSTRVPGTCAIWRARSRACIAGCSRCCSKPWPAMARNTRSSCASCCAATRSGRRVAHEERSQRMTMTLLIEEVRSGRAEPRPRVDLRVKSAIGILTMQDVHRRNALSSAFVQELLEALASCNCRKLRAVILRAAPESTVWSAGHDVRELPETRRDPLGFRHRHPRVDLRHHAGPPGCALQRLRLADARPAHQPQRAAGHLGHEGAAAAVAERPFPDTRDVRATARAAAAGPRHARL